MPNPNDVAQEEEVVEQDTVSKEGETLAEEQEPVAEATEASAGAEEGKDEKDPIQARIDEAVGKALAAQADKLAEARKEAEAKARVETERDFYKQEVERARNPKKEPQADPEPTLPEGFDLLPQAAQNDYLAEKRARMALKREIDELKQGRLQDKRESLAEVIDNTIEDMKADKDNYPGFAEVYPKIEEMGRKDPAFMQAVISNPRKYLKMAWRDLTAESIPEIAEREYEKKLEKQRKSITTRPPARDNGGTRKLSGVNAALEKAWSDAGGEVEE